MNFVDRQMCILVKKCFVVFACVGESRFKKCLWFVDEMTPCPLCDLLVYTTAFNGNGSSLERESQR